MVLILTSDFKVEEMFSPVETSDPTKLGRNEGEIQVVTVILLC